MRVFLNYRRVDPPLPKQLDTLEFLRLAHKRLGVMDAVAPRTGNPPQNTFSVGTRRRLELCGSVCLFRILTI